MSTQEMELASGAPAPDRLGQGTAVEQSRAVASVQAMVVLARQFPRDEKKARQKLTEACRSPELAEKAFYAFPRGNQTVSGLTIAAAVEMARCWGNLEYGLTELRRDEVYGQSEMQAFAWDLETNVPNRHTFIVQHGRGKSSRDVYEQNTNDGNRRMREAILRQLPRWYRVAAEKTLRATLRAMAADDGKSLEERIEGAVNFFADTHAVTQDQVEAKLGAARRRWTEDDVIELRILAESLKRREVTIDQAFPSALVTADELAADAEAPLAASSPQASAQATPAPVEHLDHPAGEWMDGCPGCIADSDAADQEADDGDA